MRHFLKTALILLSIVLAGCAGKKADAGAIPFFYDSNFEHIAKFSPLLFTGDENTQLFPELDRIAGESGVSLNAIAINDMEEGFISKIQAALPSDAAKPVIIISHLYAYADVVSLLAGRNVLVVGPTLDIDVDAVDIVGNGFDLIREEGKSLSSFSNIITYIMPDNKFQQCIKDAFIEGTGDKAIAIYPVNMESQELSSQALTSVYNINGLVIAAYGRYFKQISSPKARSGMLRVINYPGRPELMDQTAQKKTEKVLFYDFTGAFKKALENIGKKGVVYSFELIRR